MSFEFITNKLKELKKQAKRWKNSRNDYNAGCNDGIEACLNDIQELIDKPFLPENFGFINDGETEFRKYFVKQIGDKYYDLKYFKRQVSGYDWELKLNNPFVIPIKITSHYQAEIIFKSLGIIE
jgi:hypothetical protein